MVQKFRQFWLTRILMVPILWSLSGCVYLVVGGIGALGGYVVSPDTVAGVAEYGVEEVWTSTVEVISIMGLVLEEYETGGMMVADIAGAKVTITLTPLGQDSTRLSIKSRKAFLPRISMSQDVYVKILSQLES